MTDAAVRNVLFLCTHNSARSVLSESILNALGDPRLRGLSAGSTPRGTVNPIALETLKRHGHDISGLRSKSWDEFAGDDALPIHFVITLCDDAAEEACPYWPGGPVKGHWGLPDPSRVDGGEDAQRIAFENTFQFLSAKMAAFAEIAASDRDDMAAAIADFSDALRAEGRQQLTAHRAA